MHTKNECCRPYPEKLTNELSCIQPSISIGTSFFQAFAPSIPPRAKDLVVRLIFWIFAKVTTNQKHETRLGRAVSLVLKFSRQLSLVSWSGSWRVSLGIGVCLCYTEKTGLGSLGLEITNKNKNGTEIWAKSRLEMEFGKNLSLGFITWIYLFSSFFGALLKYGEIEHMERQNSLITPLCYSADYNTVNT